MYLDLSELTKCNIKVESLKPNFELTDSLFDGVVANGHICKTIVIEFEQSRYYVHLGKVLIT